MPMTAAELREALDDYDADTIPTVLSALGFEYIVDSVDDDDDGGPVLTIEEV
jgi:hypothetical protein